jgi:hypothetical protein
LRNRCATTPAIDRRELTPQSPLRAFPGIAPFVSDPVPEALTGKTPDSPVGSLLDGAIGFEWQQRAFVPTLEP